MKYFILLILFLIEINSKIISFPFKYNSTKNNYKSNSYNSSNFLNEYYIKELLIQMNIGSPFQKINAYLSPETYCFEFKKSESNYYPYKSSSFSLNKDESTPINSFNYITSSDIFNFNNNENESYKLTFRSSGKLNISSNKDISLIPEIGINNPLMYIGSLISCNNFIDDLKK